MRFLIIDPRFPNHEKIFHNNNNNNNNNNDNDDNNNNNNNDNKIYNLFDSQSSELWAKRIIKSTNSIIPLDQERSCLVLTMKNEDKKNKL